MNRANALLFFPLAMALAAAIAFADPSTRPATQPVPPHLVDAEAIAHGIDADHNQYASRNYSIRWKGEDGAAVYENHTDCSGFLDLLLAHAYHITSGDLVRVLGKPRPGPPVWYDAIAAGKVLDRVPTISRIQPGDIIAVKYPPGGKDTGHVMIVAAVPRRREAAEPLVEGTAQWEVQVIDSSKSGHGPHDTRRLEAGGFNTGVGEGALRLYAAADGTPAGYAWSLDRVSKFEPRDVHPIVVGRIRVEAFEAGK